MVETIQTTFSENCEIEDNKSNFIKSLQQPIFVPLSSPDSYKCYLREEMLAVRDQATIKEWSEYGRKYMSFDESEIIRLLAKKNNELASQKKIEKKELKPKKLLVCVLC